MNYLQWLAAETPTAWWHDSGDPAELELALENGAVGVTTNPPLCAQALAANRDRWRDEIQEVAGTATSAKGKAEGLMRIVVTRAAKVMEPIHARTGGRQGYVCAQVDPTLAGSRRAMEEMGRRLAGWAPNIAVKLPATSAGLAVMERLSADGIAVTITVSFSVPQVLAAGRRYQEVVRRSGAGRAGRCFAVIMIGRLDDYLREVFADNEEPVTEAEVRMAGLCVARHACRLYRENGLDATLLVAAMRGAYHLTELAGAPLVLSVHPTWQRGILEACPAQEQRIDEPMPAGVEEKLQRIPEFARAYDASGLSDRKMISFGLTQRTLAQFVETGWRPLEQFQP